MRSSILVLSGAFLAAIMAVSVWAWQYQDLPMVECAWCHRTKGLNRCHIQPQHAFPALANTPSNLVVLCRDCHFVLQHRCNWKTYVPEVMDIITKYTNVCANVPEGDDNDPR